MGVKAAVLTRNLLLRLPGLIPQPATSQASHLSPAHLFRLVIKSACFVLNKCHKVKQGHIEQRPWRRDGQPLHGRINH